MKFGFAVFLIFVSSFAFASDQIELSFVGDIFIGTPSEKTLSKEIVQLLQKSQLAIGNLEGPICEIEAEKRPCRGDQKTCYFYKMPVAAGELLAQAGFDFLSVANNHVFDFGEPCFKATLEHLEKMSILTSGLKGSSTVKEIDGLKIGIIAAHTASWANDLYDISGMTQLIRNLKKEVDVLVLTFHAGAEGHKARELTFKEENDFGERRGNPVEFARRAVEAGVDLVVGHGPHVLRGLEIYRGKLIAYSLGNFSTAPGFNLKGDERFGAILQVRLGPGGRLASAQIISTLQASDGSVSLDRRQNGIKQIRDRSRKLKGAPAMSGKGLVNIEQSQSALRREPRVEAKKVESLR